MVRFICLFVLLILIQNGYAENSSVPTDIISLEELGDTQAKVQNQANVQKWRTLKVGMSQDQVRQILGEPTHIDDPASDNPVWVYYTEMIPQEGSRLYFGTIGPFWNQQKLVVIKWEEPS